MSNRYKGGIISATPPTTTGGETGVASGAWTLEQQLQAQAAGNWPIQPLPVYVEDVFQTWLYTGNGSTQTITNGVNLSGKGGMTLFKIRNTTYDWQAFDTARGPTKFLSTNGTGSESTNANSLTAFNSNGFTLGSAWTNDSGAPYASWTFREQPKFFDVVTWTGNGVNNRWIDHNLASTPGAIIIKRTDTNSNWFFYHRSLFGYGLFLNTTAAETSANSDNGFVSSTSATQFRVTDGGVSMSNVNASGGTYVAYLFAHNAGGFGPTEADNVISCGSFTTNGSGAATISLGYEPQWILTKRANGTGAWGIYDTMRGWSFSAQNFLLPNTSGAEGTINASNFVPTATGFNISSPYDASANYIYIAIRRGPMRTPTTGTSVFAPALASSSGTYTATSNFPVDWAIEGDRASTTKFFAGTRLTGDNTLQPNTTGAESAQSWGFANMTGFTLPGVVGNYSGFINWMMRRAPGFFDVVCYTGDSSGTKAITHNLGVAPELYIVKGRTGSPTYGWYVYSAALGNTKSLVLNTTAAEATTTWTWDSTSPTASSFYVTSDDTVGGAGRTYVAYLFASCPGVSKVGSYTGTGTTQVINCGFTGGARFVLIKRTDSTGDWYVWDTARGMIPANDPYLLLNSTAAEVTGTDFVDTAATGFEITSTAPAAINANGGTFIFLAIA